MKKTLKKPLTSKKGITILSGEKVEVTFNVRNREGKLLPEYIRLTTEDGRSVITGRFSVVGIEKPSHLKLTKWSFDGVAKSVFGSNVELDGWSYDGSPSWMLVLGYY